MNRRPDRGDVAELGERIRSLKEDRQVLYDREHPVNQAHLAWRMVIDLVVGVGVGAAVGFGLDHLLGTLPILMAVFTLLGLAAGVNLMLRTAREVDSAERVMTRESDRATPGPDAGPVDRDGRGEQGGS